MLLFTNFILYDIFLILTILQVFIMSYIFIDESGDLGGKKSSSNYFVMAGIKVDDYKKLDRIIRKTRNSTKKNIISNEIKGNNLPKYIKIKILKKLNNINYEIFIIVFEKRNRHKISSGYDNKELYDVLASELAKLICIDDPTFIFIDKSKNKQEEITRFNKKFLKNLNNLKNYPVSLMHVDSVNYKGLQVADLISWSIFQNVEKNDTEFTDLIKNKRLKIVFED